MLRSYRTNRWKFALVLLVICFGFQARSQNLLISEIVPDNDGSLVDTDGDSSDWIEIYNNSDSPIDLEGWHLTDDAANPAQWTFPTTNIAPGSFIVAFASDKNRVIAGKELHTNFKLKSSGEYIGLIRPDLSTADGFTYPELPEGVSYGREFAGVSEQVLVDEEAGCSYHIPTNETDQVGWQQTDFNDAAWRTGQTGIGYEARSGYESLLRTSLLEMRYQNTSAYIRIPFNLANAESITGLKLEIKYDDGFVGFLNGSSVLSENTDGTETWNSGAGGPGNDLISQIFEEFDLSPFLSNLRNGSNILAIHALNDSTDLQDMLILPRLTARYSAGINTGTPSILESATPNRPNAPSEFEGFVEQPTIFPQHGFYSSPLEASITCPTVDSVIRYTLDGSEPTTNSAIYTQPLVISGTTTLRARSFSNGWKPSYSKTHSYLFLEDVIEQPADEYIVNGQKIVLGMDQDVVAKSYIDSSNQTFNIQDAFAAIPSICITTDSNNLFDPDTGIYVNAYERWERPASIELIQPDGAEDFHINAGLRIRGGYSRNPSNPKHSFRLFFRGQYGAPKLKFPMFGDEGVDEFDKIDLRTAQNYSWAWSKDPRNTLLRDVFCRDAARDMGCDHTRSRYYHLFLNGIYWGIYMTEERPEARHAAAYMGGDKDDYDTIKRKSGRNGVEATDGNLNAFERMFEFTMQGFTNNTDYFAIQGMEENGNPDPTKERLADITNMIDYLLLIYYSAATDNCITWFHRNSSVNNMYAVYNRNNPDGFKWFQHDSEHSFDTSQELDRTGPYDHANFRLSKFFNAQTMHEKMCSNPEYRLTFADRVHKHFSNEGALTQQQSEIRLDARIQQLDRAIVAHSARWGNSQLNRNCWQDAAERVRTFFEGRCDDVIGYLRTDGLIPSITPPSLIENDTKILLHSSEGAIYFTTDSADPRAIGGTSIGQLYSSPILITRPTLLRARVKAENGEWSALTEQVVGITNIPLQITEVMYHGESNQLDFVEIQNITTEPLILSGYSLEKGLQCEFGNGTLPPGGFLIAAKSTNALSSTYSVSSDAMLVEYRGNLDNSEEKITLNFFGQKLYSISYSDARNWPQAADGGGHSLVPKVSGENDLLLYGGNWRASERIGGSPGAVDPNPGAGIVINEITAHTDTGLDAPFDSNDQIELYNGSSDPIDLSGWYLSDNLENPQRWTIPQGTVIGARSHLLFDEDDFHAGRTNTSGFGLDKAGEMVVLSTDTRIIDAIRFKGQANGASYGRYPSGGPWIPMLPTPGTVNMATTSPLLISGIMYHPVEGAEQLEYIRMVNTRAQTLTFETPSGSWRIDGGIDYEFPQNFSLPPGQALWLVPFSPEQDGDLLTQFCSTYNLDKENELIMGPYSGHLSNGGERISIEYPQASDDPLKPEEISWVVVDEVFYSDRSPWPEEADGTGKSLIRTGVTTWSVH